jgi:hypothetical protein
MCVFYITITLALLYEAVTTLYRTIYEHRINHCGQGFSRFCSCWNTYSAYSWDSSRLCLRKCGLIIPFHVPINTNVTTIPDAIKLSGCCLIRWYNDLAICRWNWKWRAIWIWLIQWVCSIRRTAVYAQQKI